MTVQPRQLKLPQPHSLTFEFHAPSDPSHNLSLLKVSRLVAVVFVYYIQQYPISVLY